MSRTIAICMCLSALLFSCHRSSDQVWEDAKTGKSYLGKGFRSAAGKHGSSRQVESEDEFAGAGEEGAPLKDQDLYQKLAVGDAEALKKLDGYTPIPQSKLIPGEPGSGIPGIDSFSDPAAMHLENLYRNIHFDTDDFIVRGAENKEIIVAIAEHLKKNPKIFLFIEGHADERGTAAYNMSLGAKRSNSVRSELIKNGVSLERLFTVSYGKEKPITMAHSEDGWRVNRRSQFRLYDQQ